MRCIVCKTGETRPGHTTVTLERGNLTLVTRGVPARVCSNCGEAYVEEHAAAHLLQTAEAALRDGAVVEVREYREPVAA